MTALTDLSPTSPPPISRFHLTAEQVRFFDEQGYLILRNWVTGDLLTRLQGAGQRWIERGLEDGGKNSDHLFAVREAGRVMWRVDYVHDKGEPVSLELLGSPEVLGVAESLCGPNFVPTYESMVFKFEGDGEKVPWHQDAVHPRRWRIFNYDLYLDESRAGGGALRVIPKSQTAPADVCELAEQHGWDAPGSIYVEMEPGDVLLHDVMVVHGSERAEGKKLRRTIYYEFRAAEQIAAEGPWDQEWTERRMRLLPLALRRRQEAAPEHPQFDWQAAPEFRPASLGNEQEELRVVHLAHTPGSYCSAGDVKLDQ
ncbi:phytanoyl-CoA dioxygenase family protein [Deinococcus oregonensis]|uniref:Phytanoyl-CoA dioxygenase family protein n=1 Tax=Deinococcus oregonensis TaxID=1805970 RepID=A0ABV6B0J2_9DEIO